MENHAHQDNKKIFVCEVSIIIFTLLQMLPE